jgi:hypothetical protein
MLAGAADRSAYDRPAVMRQLTGSDTDRGEAVQAVLYNTARADAAVLFLASGASHRLGQLENAGFLFYAAQMRADFDIERFEGGDAPGGPGALFGAMHVQVGESINPAIVRNPPAYARILERLEAWDVGTSSNYTPGWDTRGRVRGANEASIARETKERYLTSMRPMAKLLQDPAYFAAFVTFQDFNLATFDEQADPQRIAARDAAVKTMLGIERREGLSVLSRVLGEPSE